MRRGVEQATRGKDAWENKSMLGPGAVFRVVHLRKSQKESRPEYVDLGDQVANPALCALLFFTAVNGVWFIVWFS